MKLGIGLYRDMLNKDSYTFAKQAGCTDVIAHLANYYVGNILPSTNEKENYGVSILKDPIWERDSIIKLKKEMEQYGLNLYGIENFAPSDWYDVLLDGPKREEQMDCLKTIIKNVGEAGIKTFGYNFSIAGVWGHERKNAARGGAESACFDDETAGKDYLIPLGEVWNMTYDQNAPEGYLEPVTHEQLWDRYARFINEILPVAEEYGVQMALHPDDPPMPTMRGQARLVYQPDFYKKLKEINPSHANGFELCLGSIQEMTEGDLYDTLRYALEEDRAAYIHFRNVKGKVPHYKEVFVDEGDIDMIKVVEILNEYDYQGVVIPDHTPFMHCSDGWHAGMAYALGYMRALQQKIEGR
ncbi:MAG: mannonate dehydratase [Enterocloster sp.]|nr:mannonate dehydratase [Enterocloster sp.]